MSKTMQSKTKQTRKTKVLKIRLINIIAIVIIVVMTLALITKLKTKSSKIDPNFVVTPEILRSREYDIVHKGDEATNSEYVKFDAFFLKDLNGDGKADSIRGTCNEIGKEDTLYMDLKVIEDGYLKDGVIKINSDNFYLNTAIVKDSSIAQNYISSNTKIIELKNMQNGMQKLLTGIVRSGDYSSNFAKISAIGNDTTKYSKVNSVTITGTHVATNGTETPINKTINFNVDWYGKVTAGIAITNVKNTVEDISELVDEDSLNLEFEMRATEKENELILKSNYLEGTMPDLNGYMPTKVEIIGENITSTYEEETGKFTVKKEAVVNENEEVTQIVNTSSIGENRYNTYKFKVKYPKEAYDAIENSTSIDIFIPVQTKYEGFNNPSNQFENPYISNTAQATVAVRWIKYQGSAYRFDVKIGNYVTSPYSRYVVSKEKPLKIYNGISAEEKDDTYIVTWTLSTGNDTTTGAIMKETENGKTQSVDTFKKKDNSEESMENITSNIGIYFTGCDDTFGKDGWIKVYNDETNELIETFTKDNWNIYSKYNPYKYSEAIKHIRIETSSVNKKANFDVNNVKELDDAYITENKTIQDFDNIQYIKTNLVGYFGETPNIVSNNAVYEGPISVAKINNSNKKISTQETCKNQIITIKTEKSFYNEQKWKNGTFLVKMPSEIIEMEINSVTINNENVKIIGYDLYEENENYFIKILTENETEEIYDITIDCNITPDPRKETTTKSIELYATNEQAVQYYYNEADTYDINENQNTSELINKTSTAISLISPNEILTHQIAKDYDKEKNETIAPRVAKVDKEQRTATVEITVANNYTENITDIVIQGVIPFEGNKYITGNSDLGSTYSTNISNTGITVPRALNNIAKVYYSTEERPSSDLQDQNNKWTLAENVEDWSKIKAYIIDLENYEMTHGEEHIFTYQINIPNGLEYNEVSYSEHAINFSLMTENGKYTTYTAPNKLGFMIAKQYDLEIEKYQKNIDKKIKGTTFKVTENGKNDSKIKVTDEDGKIAIKGLFAEREYIIEEIKTPDDYAINTEKIKFYTYTDENDKLYLTYKNDDNTYSNLKDKYNWIREATITQDTNEDYKVKLQLEDEVRQRLKINKIAKDTGEPLQYVTFNINGKGIDKSIRTDENGILNISGLFVNEEYTITEQRARGYYLIEPIKIKTINNNGTYELQIIEGNVKEESITYNDSIPEINLSLENEKIPTYSLEITKIEETSGDTEKTLQNAKYILKGEDDKSQRSILTGSNGKTTINDLYQFIDGKNITGKYTLKEIEAPNGYTVNSEEINFVVKKNVEDKLEIDIENKDNLTSLKDVTIDENIIKLKLQDKPSFKLVKTDKETGEPLAGVKFIIYELNEAGEEIGYAKDVGGNYVGTLNSKNQYEIVTDELGEITIPLKSGIYKAIEIQELEGYKKGLKEEIFKIEDNKKQNVEVNIEEKETTQTLEINYIEDLLDFSNNVNSGNNYENTKVILKRDLDFADINSYRDANNTSIYGDYNQDGTVEAIKEELSKGQGFVPIGVNNLNSCFSGIFDGQYYKIENLYESDKDNSGLFGVVMSATIKNVIVFGSIKNTKSYAGGILGYGYDNIQIINCENNINIEANSSSTIGGIIGCSNKFSGDQQPNVKIVNCKNNGIMNATGNSQIGGIAGYIRYGNIEIINCENNGIIYADSYSGGIVGEVYGNSLKISNCSNNATLYLGSLSGGIVGRDGCPTNISQCDNNAEVFLGDSSAGILGYSYAKTEIDMCNNYGTINGSDSSYHKAGIVCQLDANASSICNCSNYGDVYAKGENNGGIAGRTYGDIYNCRNYGDIIAINNEYFSYSGGIVGAWSSNDNEISYCINEGELKCGSEYYASYNGGILGINSYSNGTIKNCYNSGNIIGSRGLGGISYLFCGTVKNCYNTGDIYFRQLSSPAIGGIEAGSNLKKIENVINLGNLYFIGEVQANYIMYEIYATAQTNEYTNSYYLDKTIEDLKQAVPVSITENGEAKTQEELNSREFFETLNTDGSWIYRGDKAPVLKMPTTNARNATEISFENSKYEYKIYTDIEEYKGAKGGTISGEDENPYETVKYKQDSTKEINIVPDTGYEITKITINGEIIDFEPNNDGSYQLPLFEDMTENKKVVVSFGKTDSIITINKVDSKTNETLSGATFKLDQIEEREEPENVIGNLADNGEDIYSIDLDNEMTGVLGGLTNNGTYYFVEEDGKYVPTNSKTYQTEHGGSAGIKNSTANSYIKLDLSKNPGSYIVVVNEENSADSGNYGYATITNIPTAPTYNNSSGRFIYNNGLKEANNYSSAVIRSDGDPELDVYYIHLGYYKTSLASDTYQDQAIFNSIKVYKAKSDKYNFASNNGKYESTNQGKDGTTASSYIPIDLRRIIRKI